MTKPDILKRIDRLEKAADLPDVPPLVIYFLGDDDEIEGSVEYRLQFGPKGERP